MQKAGEYVRNPQPANHKGMTLQHSTNFINEKGDLGASAYKDRNMSVSPNLSNPLDQNYVANYSQSVSNRMANDIHSDVS